MIKCKQVREGIKKEWRLVVGLAVLALLTLAARTIPLDCQAAGLLIWSVMAMGVLFSVSLMVYRLWWLPRSQRPSRRRRRARVRHFPDYQDFPI